MILYYKIKSSLWFDNVAIDIVIYPPDKFECLFPMRFLVKEIIAVQMSNGRSKRHQFDPAKSVIKQSKTANRKPSGKYPLGSKSTLSVIDPIILNSIPKVLPMIQLVFLRQVYLWANLYADTIVHSLASLSLCQFLSKVSVTGEPRANVNDRFFLEIKNRISKTR